MQAKKYFFTKLLSATTSLCPWTLGREKNRIWLSHGRDIAQSESRWDTLRTAVCLHYYYISFCCVFQPITSSTAKSIRKKWSRCSTTAKVRPPERSRTFRVAGNRRRPQLPVSRPPTPPSTMTKNINDIRRIPQVRSCLLQTDIYIEKKKNTIYRFIVQFCCCFLYALYCCVKRVLYILWFCYY